VADKPTLAQITYISENELIVSSRHGDLLISMGDESQTVKDGTSYRMMISPSDGPGPQGQITAGKNKFYLILIIVAAVGAGVATYLALETDVVPAP
jgi:hypothetical protein